MKNIGTLANGKGPFDRAKAGSLSDYIIKGVLITGFTEAGVQDNLWIEPNIDRNGRVIEKGLQGAQFFSRGPVPSGQGTHRPDYLISDRDPTTGPGWLIGDIKLSGDVLYNQYVGGRNAGQIDSIFNYAATNSITHVALFLAVTPGDRGNLDKIKKKWATDAFSHGVIFILATP